MLATDHDINRFSRGEIAVSSITCREGNLVQILESKHCALRSCDRVERCRIPFHELSNAHR
jgi:hypothetical protein